MKQMKQMAAILLTLALMLSLAACGSTSVPDAADNQSSAEPVSAAEIASNSSAEAVEDPVVEPETGPELDTETETETEELASAFVNPDLPLVEEPTELSLWVALKPFLMAYNLDINDLTFYREMEARTGVSLDISSVAIFAANEAFNLIIASGDYPDMMDSFQVMYTGSSSVFF